MTRRRGRRSRKLLDDLKDRRGYSHLREEALDRTMWRNRFRGGFGPVVRQNTERMNVYILDRITTERQYQYTQVLNGIKHTNTLFQHSKKDSE